MAETAPNDTRPKLLVVDDDHELCSMLVEYLGPEGFATETVGTGPLALDRLAHGSSGLVRSPVDLVVLDVMLPELSGFEVLRRIRATSRMPVIMLTARGEEVDRVVGLEMGADDYLGKPFNPRELVARIHAVLRRHGDRVAPGAPTTEGRVPFGGHTLDLAARTLERDGQTTTLTTGEFSLIKVLVQHPRQPLAREKLMLLARGRDHEVFDRAIDVQVSRLRKLVEPDPANPRYIQTVWGFGYVYVPDDGAPVEGSLAAPAADTSGTP